VRNKEIKLTFALCILCLGLLLSGIVGAEDTYGAYPGAPSQVTTPEPTQTTVTTAASTETQIPQTGAYMAQPTTTTTNTVTALYSTQAPPVTQQNVVLTYDIQTAAPPAAVYYSGSYLPWTSFYQVFPKNSPALWISSTAGWSWYANCPVGGWVQELMFVPVTGTMKVYDLYPDGTTRYYTYGLATPGYKVRWFRADTPGRYMTMLTISDIPSNYIIMDVA